MPFMTIADMLSLNTVNIMSYDIFTSSLHKKHELRAMKLRMPKLTKQNSIKVPQWVRNGDIVVTFNGSHKFIFNGHNFDEYIEGYRPDITNFPSVNYFTFATGNKHFVFQFNEYIHEREIKIRSKYFNDTVQKFTNKVTGNSIFIRDSLDKIKNNMNMNSAGINTGISYFRGSVNAEDPYYLNDKDIILAGISEYNLCTMDW